MANKLTDEDEFAAESGPARTYKRESVKPATENKLTDKSKEQTKLAADSVKDLGKALDAAEKSDGDPVAAYADARRIVEDITRYIEAAEAAVTPEMAEASATNHPEWKKKEKEI